MQYKIESLAKGGEGIARVDGKTYFIAKALPGEEGEFRVVEDKKNFGRGEIVKCNKVSHFRIKDTCPVRQCGGCGFRHVKRENALEFKANAVHDNISRQAHLPADIPVQYWPVSCFDGSRRRVRIHVSRNAVGFYAASSHKIVDISKCLMLHEALKKAVADVAKAFVWKCDPILDFQIDLDDQNRAYVEVTVPEIEDTSTKSPRFKEERRPKMRRPFMGRFEISSVENYLSDAVERGIFAGALFENRFWGKSSLRDIVTVHNEDVVTWRRIGRFAQATAEANAHLHAIVDNALKKYEPNTVYDLFCGAGNFTFRAALTAKHVVGVEFFGDRDTFAEGEADTAARHKLNDIKLRLFDLNKGLPSDMTQADFVITDPARVGMTAELCQALITLDAPHILYISCEASCLARDLNLLMRHYEPIAMHYVDMFPGTPDVETVVLLKRKMK